MPSGADWRWTRSPPRPTNRIIVPAVPVASLTLTGRVAFFPVQAEAGTDVAGAWLAAEVAATEGPRKYTNRPPPASRTMMTMVAKDSPRARKHCWSRYHAGRRRAGGGLAGVSGAGAARAGASEAGAGEAGGSADGSGGGGVADVPITGEVLAMFEGICEESGPDTLLAAYRP